jgi:biuret amidohydrolase
MDRALEELAGPPGTALVFQECQRGVIGDRARLRDLADAATGAVTANLARLAAGARHAGVQVIHCLAVQREDYKGSNTNARLFAGARKRGVCLMPGSAEAEVVPEIGVHRDDLVLTRLHGLGPMTGTDLDSILRNLGITTVVAAGVSVNVAITNLVMDAVNRGYRVVLPEDAVAGVPGSYARDVIHHTLSLLATVVTTEELLAAWQRTTAPPGDR